MAAKAGAAAANPTLSLKLTLLLTLPPVLTLTLTLTLTLALATIQPTGKRGRQGGGDAPRDAPGEGHAGAGGGRGARQVLKRCSALRVKKTVACGVVSIVYLKPHTLRPSTYAEIRAPYGISYREDVRVLRVPRPPPPAPPAPIHAPVQHEVTELTRYGKVPTAPHTTVGYTSTTYSTPQLQ